MNPQNNTAGVAGGGGLGSSSNLLAPIVDLRRQKPTSRSNLVGGAGIQGGNSAIMTTTGGSTIATAMTMDSGDQRVKLERVIGMTVNSVAALTCDPVNGLIAYPAGCTVVLYSSKRNRQAHIINPARKTITSVAFSPDGNYLAAGECGHQPCVRVWEVEERTQVAELQGGHQFGVSCLMFSPDMKYLISVGNQFDNVVNVWNWRNQRKSSTSRVSCKVKAISFSEDGSYFVTVGVRHVKFWYLERNKTATPKYQDTAPLQGRSAILADQRNNFFCDVACGRGAAATKTFAITQSGLLCEFNNKRLLERWLDLKTRCAYSITLSADNVFVGCADGIVHVFKANGLAYLATMPRPHALGLDIATASLNASSSTSMVSASNNNNKFAKYPDAVALRFDEARKKLTCIYNDHSMYQWEIMSDDYKRIGKSYSNLAHGGCIWSVEMYPSAAQFLPPGTFFTGGSDDTIRVWNLDPNMPADTTAVRKNVYSHELLKIIYADPQLAHLCDTELGVEKQENQYDGKSGIRAIKTSPDGRQLATGDRSGNLRIYSVPEFALLYQLSAHDSEVLCLEYSSFKIGSYFLASSSRDRLLHVLDPTRNYEPVCTIDDHSSAITSVKFARGSFNAIRHNSQQQQQQSADNNHDHQDEQDDLIMLSGGADKSIIIRKMVPDAQGQQQFVRANYVALQSTVYDMDVDERRSTVLAACQDRQIRAFHIADGKFDRAFKGSSSDDTTGTVIKLELDPSCTYAATSTSDKLTYVIDARSGEFIASLIGHGELVTGLKFSNDCRHLITVSGDGCVFVWRLATELTNRMLSRLTRSGKTRSDVSNSDMLIGSTTGERGDENVPRVRSDSIDDDQDEGEEEERRLHNVQLPSWAKKPEDITGQTPADSYQYKPKGRWAEARNAQRSEPDGLEAVNNDAHGSARGGSGQSSVATATNQQQQVGGGSSVQKLLKQFETDSGADSTKSGKRSGRGATSGGDGDFGSLMNVRLIGTDEDSNEDGRKKDEVENLVVYPNAGASDSNEDAPSARDFVVKERSLVGAKPYRGAETMGDLSDDDSAAPSSTDTGGGSMRMSESVGELHPRQHRMVLDAFEKLETSETQIDQQQHADQPSDQSFERGGSKRQSITSRYLQRTGDTPSSSATPSSTTAVSSSTAATTPHHQQQPLANQIAGGPRSRWVKDHSPIVPARILVTPSTSISSHQRSALTSGTPETTLSDSWRTAMTASQASPLVDESIVNKAKLLSEASKVQQNRDRRQTFHSFDRALVKRKEENEGDYASSVLHQRSRSRSRTGTSPSRQSNAGDSETSEMSGTGGAAGYRQRRKPPVSYFNSSGNNLVTSRSMTSLVSSPGGGMAIQGKPNGDMKRLNDIRERLRKSQENIAFGQAVASGATTPMDGNSSFGDWNDPDRLMAGGTVRSKSFGNLYGASGGLMDTPPRKASTPVRNNDGPTRLRSLLQSRGIALSTGNLGGDGDHPPTTPDGNQSMTTPTTNRQRMPSTSGGGGNLGSTSNLVGAIMDFKKRSATDLSQTGVVMSGGHGLTNEDRSDSVLGSFYGKVASMPRRHHAATSGVGKKAQAIRSQRFTATSSSNTDRMSVSGESEDSSSIDYYNGPRTPTGGGHHPQQPPSMTRSQIITPSMRQRLDLMADQNSSRSSSPGGGQLQQQQHRAYDAAKQIFEAKQRQSQTNLQMTPTSASSSVGGKSSTNGRPHSSYLAKLLHAGDDGDEHEDEHQQQGGAGSNYFAQGGRHLSEGSALNASKRMSTSMIAGGQSTTNSARDRLSAIVDSCDNHFDKMSGHCKDSVNQFRTSLDKVLQAHNMVIDDTDLTEEERDELLRMLSLELEAARERLNHALTAQQRSSVSSPSSSAAHHHQQQPRYSPIGARGDDGGRSIGGGGAGRRQSAGAVMHPTTALTTSPPAGQPSTPGGGDKRDASFLLQEYSDMLVTLIQQKMSSSPDK